MTVIDFQLTRFVSDSHSVAERLLEESETLLDEDPEAAGIRAVEAWMVLNSAAVVATRINRKKLLDSIRKTRNKIMALSGALQTHGYAIQDVPESSMAFLIAPRK